MLKIVIHMPISNEEKSPPKEDGKSVNNVAIWHLVGYIVGIRLGRG